MADKQGLASNIIEQMCVNPDGYHPDIINQQFAQAKEELSNPKYVSYFEYQMLFNSFLELLY